MGLEMLTSLFDAFGVSWLIGMYVGTKFVQQVGRVPR